MDTNVQKKQDRNFLKKKLKYLKIEFSSSLIYKKKTVKNPLPEVKIKNYTNRNCEH